MTNLGWSSHAETDFGCPYSSVKPFAGNRVLSFQTRKPNHKISHVCLLLLLRNDAATCRCCLPLPRLLLLLLIGGPYNNEAIRVAADEMSRRVTRMDTVCGNGERGRRFVSGREGGRFVWPPRRREMGSTEGGLVREPRESRV